MIRQVVAARTTPTLRPDGRIASIIAPCSACEREEALARTLLAVMAERDRVLAMLERVNVARVRGVQ